MDQVHFCGKLNFLMQDCHVSSKLEEDLPVSTIPHIEGGTIEFYQIKKWIQIFIQQLFEIEKSLRNSNIRRRCEIFGLGKSQNKSQ